MTNGQGLSQPTENDFLVRDETWQTHAVNMDAVDFGAARARELFLFLRMPLLRRSAHFLDHFRCLQCRAGGCVELVVMMQFDDLDMRHVLRRLTAHEHHEHGADREVRCEEDRRILLQGKSFELRPSVCRHARRADDRRNAILHGEHGIGKHGIGAREIHHDIRAAIQKRLLEICPHHHATFAAARSLSRIHTATNIDGSNEGKICIVLHRLDHSLSHASASSADQHLYQDMRPLQASLAKKSCKTNVHLLYMKQLEKVNGFSMSGMQHDAHDEKSLRSFRPCITYKRISFPYCIS